jgi:glycerol-3-phosphate dehydrogenase subunit C
MGGVATRVSFLVNLFITLPPVKFFLDRFLRIPSERRFPRYARGTFRSWYRKHRRTQEAFAEKAVYFHGCYVNYNNHELGKDVVTVLNAMNVGVIVAEEKCCGVPLIANGYIEKARKNARFNIDSLAAAASGNGARIVSASSSCSFALKHEYRNLLELDNSAIFDSLYYITRFIHERFQKGNVPNLRPVPIRAAYHSPCHLERMGGVMNTIEVLKKIPGLDLTILHSECCGIAGTYGFKKEYYKVAQKVGSELFKRIERAAPQIVITDCETCKWQIEMSTPYRVEHPVTVLARAIDGGKL